LRIISGSVKGRKISGPGSRGIKNSIRPTSDRVRESIFNILGSKSVADNVLDLFAGTGALGIEALSRGARYGTFVDRDRNAVGLILKNLSVCGFTQQSTVHQKDIDRGLAFLKRDRPENGFDLVFMDPPYNMGSTLNRLEELQKMQIIAAKGLIVVEDASKVELPLEIYELSMIDFRRYGDTSVWIYENRKMVH
jgi:16S rRNA (guanine966-N2)-methyltransferase